MKPIDIHAITRKLGRDADFAAKWLRKFVNYSPVYLLSLREYARQKDYRNLYQAACKLHGTVSLLGLEELQAKVGELLASAKDEKAADYQHFIAEIESMIRSIPETPGLEP